MEISEIKELLEIIQGSTIDEFEMEKSGVRVKIKKFSGHQLEPGIVREVLPAVSSAETTVAPSIEKEEEGIYLFRAPIVGTYYLTPKPDADPFVEVGSRVTQSSVLCIIEAMKIFNQIECDVSGEIVKILVENGKPVEYGEPLFKIRLD
jgi:acetyl-CoA carboxylase biotin carboxyl carrier protein